MSDWIHIDEGTLRFGLSRATIYRLIAEGRVRRAKRAGDVRSYVRVADLKAATTLQPVGLPRPRQAKGRRKGPRG